MKRIHPLLSLLLAGLLVCGTLASCSSSDSDDDDKHSGNIFDNFNKNDDDNDDDNNTVKDPDHVHSWSDWETTTEPTCAQEGVAIRTCACGSTEKKSIAKTPHMKNVWTVVTKPTLTTSGTRVMYCAVCNQQIAEETFEADAKWVYKTDKLGYCSGYASVGGVTRDVILDLCGDVVYATVDGEEIEIYGNGYFISNLNGTQYLKKADGTEICSTQSLGITGFGLTENYEEYTQFLCDGYIFAYNVISTYTGTTYEIGILGTDGQWIVPLSAENPILTGGAKYSAAIFNKHSYEYAGEGILFVDADISGYSYDFLLYNIETNTIHRLVPTAYASNLDYMVTIASFRNGVSYGTYSSKLYAIYSDGRVTVTSNIAKSGFEILSVDASTYYTIYNNAIYRNGELYTELDCNIYDASCTEDGWLIILRNPNGDYFYTYLTVDGEFLFEPVSTTAVYICDVNGVGVGDSTNHVQDNGVKLIIDTDGRVLYTSSNSSAYIYLNNGVVCEQVKKAFSTDETFTFLK
ncbi:MAG: hypothetical protein ACI3YH_01330 [Eubacteriales bacterium]